MSTSKDFVGRERELERLDRLLDLALTGQGQVCFLAGEAGSGKTALIREFTQRAQQKHPDLVVAGGECNDLDGQGDPYLPFREVLGQLTGDVETGLAQGSITPQTANRLRSLIAKTGQVLVDIAPDLINVVIPGSRVLAMAGKAVASRVGWLEKLDHLAKKKRPESTLGEPTLQPDRVFEEYTAFLRRVSEIHPLVITLDDLHWLDKASAGLLFHLGRRISDVRILLVGAYRQNVVAASRDGERHPLDPIVREFMRYAGQVELELTPGSPAEAQAFVDAVLDLEPNRLDEAFRQALFRHTEGHPLFIAELVQALRERGDLFQEEGGRWVARSTIDWDSLPHRVEGVVGERIARLEQSEQLLLQAASVEGDTFTAEVVARVLSEEPRQVVGALSGNLGREQGLVSGTGSRRVGQQRLSFYAFRHHLVQQYLYQSMDAAQRAYYHEDVAKALVEMYGEQAGDIVGQLAWHYREAEVADLAFKYSVIAGDRASSLSANADALTHYTSAHELLTLYEAGSDELIHLFGQRGRALELSGQPRQALENYSEMEDIGRRRPDPRLVLASLTAQSVLFAVPTVIQNPDESRRLAEQALGLARDAGDRATEARLLWVLLMIQRFTGHPREAVTYGEESLARARELESREQLAYTLHDLSMAYLMLGETEQARSAVEEASHLWGELGNQPMLANALGNNARHRFFAGEFDEAKGLAEESLQVSRRIGNLSGVSFGQIVLGQILLEQGNIDQAIEAIRESVEAGEQAGNAYAITGIRAELAWALGCVGAFDEARSLAKQALDEAERSSPTNRDWSAALLARIHMLAGDPPSTWSSIPQTDLGVTDEQINHPTMFGGPAIALAAGERALLRGDPTQALESVEKLIAHLGKMRSRLHLADALQIRGKALQAQGKTEEARRALQEAREVAEAIGSRRVLWSICDNLADLEATDADDSINANLRKQSREAVEYIANHMDDPERRSVFLHLSSVEAVLAKDSGNG